MDERTQKLIESYKTQGPLSTGMIGDVFASTPANIPSTISSATISSNETPLNLPTPTPPSTTAVGISASKESGITSAYANIDKMLQDYANQKEVKATTSSNKVLEYLGLGEKALQEKIDATQTPEFKAQKDVLTKANNEIIASRKAQDAEIKALETQNLTGTGAASALNGIRQRYAFQDAQLSLTANIALNNVTAAQQDINDLYNLKMEAYQPYINYYSQLAQNDQDIFNKAELEIINSYKDEYTRQQTEETTNIKANGDAMMKFNSLGAGITINDTAEQRAQKISSVGGDLGYDLYKDKLLNKGTSVTPTIKSINGVDMQWNPATGKWEKPSITSGIDGGGQTTLPLAQAQGNVDLISGLLNDTNIRTAVGPTGIARFIGRGLDTATGGRQNFISSVEQIRSNLNLEALIGAKARGATFGALSDQELQVLASSASKIGTWAKKDKNGNVIAYNASEKDFKKELDKINNFAKLDYILKGGIPEDVGAVLMTDGKYYTKNSVKDDKGNDTYTQLTN